MEFRIDYLRDMDDYDWFEVGQKGWMDITVHWEGGERVFQFYDTNRLALDMPGDIERDGQFVGRCLVVLPELTEESVEGAVARLAARDFFDVI